MAQNQWDKYSELYDQGIGPDGNTLHQKIIDPVLFELLGDGQVKTVLDAGCGNGYLLRKLSSRAEQIVGIDSSDELLSIAKKNTVGCANVSTIKNDLMKTLSLKDKTFDVVIANMVLQYLPSLENFSAECSRILKREGRFIMIIDHPSHAAYLRAQELAGKKNEKFLTSGSYFTEEKRTKKSLWNKAILEYYHRTISSYINAFSPKFCLEKMQERSADDGEMPLILGIKWKKNG